MIVLNKNILKLHLKLKIKKEMLHLNCSIQVCVNSSIEKDESFIDTYKEHASVCVEQGLTQRSLYNLLVSLTRKSSLSKRNEN